MRTRTPRPVRSAAAPAPGGPWRRLGAVATLSSLGLALLGGCGDEQPPKLSPPAANQPAQAAAASSAPVFTAQKRWADPKGNRFTILVTINRPSNAGLNMCSMANGQFLGPSLVLSVRSDSSARALKGPQISVDNRLVAFPHGRAGCSYVFAPSDRETFDPGDSHTYRNMVMPSQAGRFEDVVLRVTTSTAGKGKLTTKELLRIPAAKLAEAYLQGPVPTGQAPAAGAAPPDHSHG